MKSLIIDCDPGIDDMLALILAHHVADIKGIVTVSGNVPLQDTTSNALLATAMLDSSIPVHAGSSQPLMGSTHDASFVHGSDGLGGVDRVDHKCTVASQQGVDFLLDAATPEDWIVAVGPLTNLARAIEKDETWVKRIRGISLMGGSSTVGNVTPVAEFNIYADPEAAARVFNSGAQIRMCGLNVTHQFVANDETLSLIEQLDTSLSRFAHTMLNFLLDRLDELVGRRVVAFHDPCAVLAVTHSNLIEFEPLHVDVETEGLLTRGMTVCDQRNSKAGAAPNASVAQTIDADGALSLLLESLAREVES